MTYHRQKILDELRWHVKKQHAMIVFRKCVAANKYKLAMKIADHYGLENPDGWDDMVVSLGIAIMAQNKVQP